MKKKWISLVNVILVICLSFSLFLPIQFSYADELTPNEYISSGPGGSNSDVGIDDDFVHRYGGDISSYLFGIAIIIAIIAVSYVGLIYITGGITQKADYKKNLIPMAVGAGIVTLLGTILKIIANAAGTI